MEVVLVVIVGASYLDYLKGLIVTGWGRRAMCFTDIFDAQNSILFWPRLNQKGTEETK